MKKKTDADFSRLNQPLMVTMVYKADGRVFELSKSGDLAEAPSSGDAQDALRGRR